MSFKSFMKGTAERGTSHHAGRRDAFLFPAYKSHRYNQAMEWLEPWWSTADGSKEFHEAFERQLRVEICPDDPIFGIPAKIIARGNGDDALFQLLDGTGRVAFVHLKWGAGRELGQFRTRSRVYDSIEAFAQNVMQPEHEDWLADAE